MGILLLCELGSYRQHSEPVLAREGSMGCRVLGTFVWVGMVVGMVRNLF